MIDFLKRFGYLFLLINGAMILFVVVVLALTSFVVWEPIIIAVMIEPFFYRATTAISLFVAGLFVFLERT
jgi:hypothetical protein